MKKTLLQKTLRNVTLAVVYILLVSQIVRNGDRLFGSEDNFLSPFVFLLLFSLSAVIVGGLVLGHSVVLVFEGKKKESILATVFSVLWLAVYTFIGILALILMK